MSVSRSRTRGGFRIGLVVCTVVVLTAACGSIDIVSGDAGGSAGNGSGGKHGGGTGGAAGGQGTGGITGAGGTGGSNHGSGGMSGGGSGGMGSGGMTGGSGGSGAGGAGGSGPSCTDLQKQFAVALAAAKMCVVGATGYCGVVTSDKLDCGCPTHVNDTKNIDPIRAQWAQSACSSGVCPQIACIAYKSAACVVPSGSSAAVCQDQVSLPTP